MAGSVNKVILLGNLTADPETKSFQNGGSIAKLRIATSESWKSKDGERQERTEYHTVIIKNDGLAGVASQYLRKGSKVYVCGSLQTRKWQDKDGADRYTTEIVLQGFGAELVLLDSRQSGGQGGRQPQAAQGDDWGGGSSRPQQQAQPGYGGGGQAGRLGDDEIPFSPQYQ